MGAETDLSLEPVRQFSIFLQNRAGALMSIVKMLNDAKIFVLGLSVQDSVDATVVRFIVSDPDTVEALFITKGIPFGATELLVVELPAGAEDLGKCLSALLVAETNINFSYPLLSRPEGKSALALHIEDTELGVSILESNGFKLLTQQDLSR